jgi:hypothetical protein
MIALRLRVGVLPVAGVLGCSGRRVSRRNRVGSRRNFGLVAVRFGIVGPVRRRDLEISRPPAIAWCAQQRVKQLAGVAAHGNPQL